MSQQSGRITGKVAISVSSSSSSSNSAIEANSRIKIQLLDITSTAGLPVILGQQEVLVNAKQAQTINSRTVSPYPSPSPSPSPLPVAPSQSLQGPITFTLTYDPKRIQPDRLYAIGAYIMSSQQRLDWIAKNKLMVLTRGAPVDNITVVLEKV
ncbi:hypothetical protein BGX26_004393 [Mortierella sp. AD094]|nr:hypothetical protein BGX26_004393 [Mortierella sp. AD094]